MEKPKYVLGLCELCNENYEQIHKNPINGKPYEDPYHSWEKVTLEFEYSHYWGPLAGSGSYLEYDICPDCFRQKVLPALYAIGLPQKKAQGWIS